MTDDEVKAICLACDAARRDAADLFVAVVEEDDGVEGLRPHQMLSGMSPERSWRVALFVAGIAAGLADSYADAVGLDVIEFARGTRDELLGGRHEH